MNRFTSSLRAAFPALAEPVGMKLRIVPTSAMLPHPVPDAPISFWTSTPTRATVTESVPGATLRGWTYASPHPDDPALLFFNGNAMAVFPYDDLYSSLAALGAKVTVFDYRGFGFSTGLPEVMSFRKDALQIYTSLLASNPGRPIIVFGFSLGTAIASWVAANFPVAALILAGTIASAEEEVPIYAHDIGIPDNLAASLVPSPEVIETLDELRFISHSTAPLLMIHGEDDAVVPIRQGREVFAASPSTQKHFVSVPGIGHAETLTNTPALEAIAAFLQSLKPTS